jgi:heat shock protein HtpX
MLAVAAVLGIGYVGLGVFAAAVLLEGSWPSRVIIAPLLVVFGWAHFWIADDLVLRASRARRVDRAEEPVLQSSIDRLALLADIAPPSVALSPLRSANSFAVGLRRQKHTVVVTRTLCRELTRTELEAVLAHEISHLANRDALVLTAASIYRSVAALFGDPALLTHHATGAGERRNYLPWILLAPVRWALLAVGAPLTRTLSRYREYTADRGAALLTGSPESLMSALIKLESGAKPVSREDLRSVAGAHPFLLLPLTTRKWSVLTDHPPLAKRLARLERMAHEMHARV